MQDNPILSLTRSLGHAEFLGFPPYETDVVDRSQPADPVTKRPATRKEPRNVRAHQIRLLGMFPQQWSSTALGFGGIGGQAFTTAHTVVLQGPMGDVLVYFSGQFAYRIAKPNASLMEDVFAQEMASVRDAGKYESF